MLFTWLQLGNGCSRWCCLAAGCAGTPQPAPAGISVQHQHAQSARQQLRWRSTIESNSEVTAGATERASRMCMQHPLLAYLLQKFLQVWSWRKHLLLWPS